MKIKLIGRTTVILGLTVGMFLSLVFATGFLAKTTMVRRMENGQYTSQVRSVLEDGDLNIFNQAPPEQRWLVSNTYNTPDFKESGSTALWLPFFIYGSWLPELKLGPRPWGDPVKNDDVATALATLFYSLLATIFSLWIMRFYLGNAHSWVSLAMLTLGTPMLWYVFFEPYGTDLSSNFINTGCVFLYLLLLRAKPSNYLWWALLGGSLAFGASVKMYGIFYLAAIILQSVLRWYLEARSSVRARQVSFLLAGVALILPIHFSNHYLKYGSFTPQNIELQRYFAMFSDITSSPFHLYFGPNGWAFTAPIYSFGVVAAGLWIYDRHRNKKLGFSGNILSVPFILFFVPLCILLVTSGEMINENYGTARRMAASQLAFLLGLQFLLVKAKQSTSLVYRTTLAVTAAASAWGFMMIFRYAANKNTWGDNYLGNLFQPDSDWSRMKELIVFWFGGVFREFPSLAAGLTGWLPAVLVCASTLVFMWRIIMNGNALRAVAYPLSFLVATFVVVGVLNLVRNESNVQELKAQGFFASTVVANGMTAFIYDDLVSVIPKFKRLGQIRNNPTLTEDADRVAKTLLREVPAQIVFDPIGFKEECNRGILRPSQFEVNRP